MFNFKNKRSVKTKLTSLLICLTTIVNAQVLITEYSLKGENIGIEVINDRGRGFYAMIGGNYLSGLMGMNYIPISKWDSDFSSTIDWYGEYGPLLPSYEPSTITTSPTYGNVLIESGRYTKTTSRVTNHWTTTHRSYNAGVVIPMGNHRLRIGGGIWITQIDGYNEKWYLTQSGYVEKYYDSWKILGNSEHFFCVEYSPTFRERTWNESYNKRTVKPNFNAAYVIPFDYSDKMSADFSLGINGGTITMGINYNFK